MAPMMAAKGIVGTGGKEAKRAQGARSGFQQAGGPAHLLLALHFQAQLAGPQVVLVQPAPGQGRVRASSSACSMNWGTVPWVRRMQRIRRCAGMRASRIAWRAVTAPCFSSGSS